MARRSHRDVRERFSAGYRGWASAGPPLAVKQPGEAGRTIAASAPPSSLGLGVRDSADA